METINRKILVTGSAGFIGSALVLRLLARDDTVIGIDNRDYYIDLLFYHRRLRRLVAIDLKIGEFEAAFKGQMELYLRYLEKHEQIEGEATPIGLILCTGKNQEHGELLQLPQSNIHKGATTAPIQT